VKLLSSFFAALFVSALVYSSRADEPFLKPNDVIALVGGEDMVAAGESGTLEFLLHRALPDYHLKLRSLAWEGDTVFEQPRMLNYPKLEQQLDEIGATVVIMQFGQSECLAGKGNLASFIAAYSKLIDRLRRPRLVLVSPTMFEEAQSQSAQFVAKLKDNNKSLIEYNNGVEELAKQRRVPFINVMIPQGFLILLGTDDFTGKWTPPLEPLVSREGQHISDIGRSFVDGAIASGLGLKPGPVDSTNPNDRRLLEVIRAKNRLWDRYRRPQNWAFLAGARTTQPSSRNAGFPRR
jgi:hypothetical protein